MSYCSSLWLGGDSKLASLAWIKHWEGLRRTSPQNPPAFISGALSNDDRNLAVGLRLVLVVIRPDFGHARPERVVLLRRRGARPGPEAIAKHLDQHLGVVLEIEIPFGVLIRATFGCHDD